MFDKITKWWYYSSIRFYYLNTVWNYSFWLKSKKVYKLEEYKSKDKNGFYTNESRNIKKFIGFEYNNKIYLDNPGFPIKDRSLWTFWKEKGLIK